MRLSESHAKLMCRNVVLIEDAVVAIALMAMSGGGGGQGLFSSLGGFGATFGGSTPALSQAMTLSQEVESILPVTFYRVLFRRVERSTNIIRAWRIEC